MPTIGANAASNNDNILQGVNATPLTPPPEGTYGYEANAIADMIGGVTDSAKQYFGGKVLKSEQQDINNVLEGRNKFDTRLRQIYQQMDEGNKGIAGPSLDQLKDDLDRLWNDEEAGAISPRGAQIKLASISSYYQNKAPAFSSQIRDLANSYNDEVSARSLNPEDVLSAQRVDRFKRAFDANISYKEQTARDYQSAKAAFAKSQLEYNTTLANSPDALNAAREGATNAALQTAAGALGHDADFNAWVSETAPTIATGVNDMFRIMYEQAKGVELSNQAQMQLTQNYQYMKDAAMQSLMDFEKANGITLDKSKIMNDMFGVSDNLFKLYSTQLDPETKLKLLQTQNNMIKEMGIKAFYKYVGPILGAGLASPEGFNAIGGAISKVRKYMDTFKSKDGKANPALLTLLESDPLNKLAYQMLMDPDMQGTYWGQVGAVAMATTEQGAPLPAPNTILGTHAHGVTIESVKHETNPQKQHDMAMNALGPDGISLGLLAEDSNLKGQWTRVIQSNADVQERLKLRISNSATALVSSLSTDTLANLKIEGGRFVNAGPKVSPVIQSLMNSGAGAAGGVAMSDMNKADLAAAELNKYMKLRGVMPGASPEEIINEFSGFVANSIHQRAKATQQTVTGLINRTHYLLKVEDGIPRIYSKKEGEDKATPVNEDNMSQEEFTKFVKEVKVNQPDLYDEYLSSLEEVK